MKNTDIKSKKTTQMNPNLIKYIVEVEEPKEGQVVSTGGVRYNGKMAAQFKNPIPYKDPNSSSTSKKINHTPATKTSNHTMKDRVKSETQEFIIYIGRDIFSMLWKNLGKPYLNNQLSKTANKLHSSSQKKHTSSISNKNPYYQSLNNNKSKEDTYPVSDSNNIIQFPTKHIV